MNIVCFATRLHPATEKALARHGRDAVTVWLDSEDDFAYWRELARWWGRGDLLVIEHDVVIGPGTVAAMRACAGLSDWCAAPYPAYQGYSLCNERALGCTRFSARLQAAVDPESFRAPWRTMADRFIALFDPLYPHRHGQVGHERALPAGVRM